MSSEHTPPSGGEPAGRGSADRGGPPGPPGRGHEHHLADELREELHELVEHVPKPVRRTVRKLALLVVLGLVGLVVVAVVTAALYVANRTEWAAGELALVVNRTLTANSDLRLELADIKGNVVTGVRLIQPKLLFRERDRAPFLQAREIRLSYRPLSLLARDKGPIDVQVEHAELRVERDARGRLIWPGWKGEKRRRDGGATRWRLRLRDASVWLGEPAWRADGLELDLSATVGPTTEVDVRSLTWASGPFRSRGERCAGRLQLADSLRLVLREFGTDRLESLRGRAAWARGPGAGGEASLEFENLRFTWLAEIFRNRTFDVPGVLSARVHVRRSPTLEGEFSAAAVWDSLPLTARGRLTFDRGRLRLAPLTGESPAGNLEGEVRWSREGWSLGGAARRADPRYWGVLGLRGWPEGDLQGRFLYEVDTRRRAPDARLSAHVVSSSLAGWRVDSARVEVLMPAAESDSFAVIARRRGGEFRLNARTSAEGWRGRYTVADFPLEEWPDGRALGLKGRVAGGQGTVEGRGARLLFDGEMQGAALDWTGSRAGRWRLRSLAGQILPVTDLRGLCRLEDVVFLGVRVDTASAPFHLAGDSLALPDVQAAAGDTLIGGGAQVTWDESRWRFRAGRLTARSSQFAWSNEGDVLLSGDPLGVRFERFRLRDGEAALELAGRWAGPGGAHDWQGRMSALQLARAGLDAGLGAAGRVDAGLRVWGPASAARWQLAARATSPGFRGHSADSAVMRLAGGPGELEVEEAQLWLGPGRLSLRGTARETAAPWPGRLDAPGLRAWLMDAARWEGTFRAEGFPLDRVARLSPAASGLKGRLSGALGFAGRPGRPEFRLECLGEDPGWENVEVDRVQVAAGYGEGRLELERCEIARGASVSHIQGVLPLIVALGEARLSVPDEPLDLHFDVPNGDLAVASLFVPQLGFAAGTISLDATLRGTVKRPDLDGYARVRNGRLRLAGREEVLKEVLADLTLDEARITLDTLSARQGDRGWVRGAGGIELEGLRVKDYRFDLALRDFVAQETSIYVAEFDGDLVVQRGPQRGGRSYPSVTGKVNLRRGIVLFDFANQTDVQQVAASTRPLDWVYSIELEAASGLRWRPSDADIDFAAGLRVEQTLDSLLIFGEVRAVRGDYFFLSNGFRIDRAVLSFDNVGGVDPRLDIAATAQVARSTVASTTAGLGPAEPSGTVDVVASIAGRASNPTIRFTSPRGEWDEPTILRALSYEQFIQGGQLALGAPLENYLTRMLSRQLSEQLSGAFGGYLREWEVSRDPSGALRLGVGTQLTRELRVRFAQALPGYTPVRAMATSQSLFERDVEAEYRLNRFVYLTTGIAQRRATAALAGESGTTTDFNVNLRVRYEY